MRNKAYINLNVLRENAISVKEKLKDKVKFCAVVKADAYGHGAPKIASAIYTIVDCFAVALVEEGIELRLSGIDKDILVLVPPFKVDLERAVIYDLTLAVKDRKQIDLINNEAKRQGKKVKIHIKFNCGMNRLGVDSVKELKELLDYIKNKKHVILDGLFSHFSAPENKKSLILQQNKFLLANNLVKRYNNKVTCHVSASGGFLKGVQFDMVRIGILLYGYKPFKSIYIKVCPIMKIVAPVLEKRRLKKGESALYGNKKAKKTTDTMLVRVGYADGFLRENDGEIFSNRCMDLTLYKGKNKKEIVVLGNADKVAKSHGTISYEILTKSAIRAEKIYLD